MRRLTTLYRATDEHWIEAMTAIENMTDADLAGELDNYALTEMAARYEELTAAVDKLCKQRVELLEAFGALPNE